MAPERPGRTLGRIKAAGEDRRVQGACELRRAAEPAAAAYDARVGLEQTETRLGLHPADHLDDGGAFHEAVGVEHHGIVVAPPARADEFGDVAGLAAGPIIPPAIVEPGIARALRDQAGVPMALGGGDRVVAGVREDGDVEAGALRIARQRRFHRGDAGPGLGGFLAADRHQDHSGAKRRVGRCGGARAHPSGEDADQRLGGAEGKPPGRRADEQDAQDIHPADTDRGGRAGEGGAGRESRQGGEDDGGRPGGDRAEGRGRKRRVGLRRTAQILRLHAERGRRRQPRIPDGREVVWFKGESGMSHQALIH